MVVTVSLSDNVSQKSLWVIAFYRDSSPEQLAGKHLDTSAYRGTSNSFRHQLFSPFIWQKPYPWFSGTDTTFSVEVSLFNCSARTASTAPRHCFSRRKPSRIFQFAWFCTILLSFLAHFWGRFCSLAQSLMSYHIFGIQFPVCLCVMTCHCMWC